MSTSTLARRRHPLTGAPIGPVGFRKNGRPIMPILGGSQPPAQPPQPAPPAAQPPAPPPAPPSQPERPDGVSEAEWAALGDPGKNALVRERARATAAEQALAAARTTPPAPKAPDPPKPAETPKGPDGQPDIAAIVQQAVAAAVAPFQEAEARREAESAASAIRDAVTTSAATRFHDPTDALLHIDLAMLTDGNGRADQQKIATALDDLLTRKPHLGKVIDSRLQAPPGTPIGGGVVGAAPLDDRVKASLARMQQATGVKFAGQA